MLPIKRFGNQALASWTAVLSLAICLFYMLFYIASNFGLQYFVLSNRGMVEKTVNGGVLSSSIDIAVWGIAIFVTSVWIAHYFISRVIKEGRSVSTIRVLALLCGLTIGGFVVAFGIISIWSLVLASGLLLTLYFVFPTDLFGVSRTVLLLRTLFVELLLILFVELASLFLFSVPSALGSDTGLLGLHWSGVELAFGNLSYPFLPYVYLLFVFLGLGAFVFRFFPNSWLWIDSKVKAKHFVSIVSGLFERCENWSFGFNFLRSRMVVVLAVVVSSTISLLFVTLTVLPWNNPTGMMVSADSPVYYDWISHMKSLDTNSALSFAFSNDRAAFLIFAYVLSFIAPIATVIQFAAALLLVLLTIVTVFVLKLFTKSTKVLVLGALLVPFSFQGLGLIYSGYFANMLALILVLVYVILFFRLLREWSSLNFLALVTTSVLVLFSHSWTWFIFSASLVVFLLLEWRIARGKAELWGHFKKISLLVVVTIGAGLLIDIFREWLSSLSSSSSALSTVQSSLGFPSIGFLISGMREAVDFILGGVFASQLFIALSFVGFLVLLRLRSEVANFFVAWVFVACLSILFAASNFVFNRALFLLPWVVLSGLGLDFIIRFVGFKVGQVKTIRGWRLWVVLLVLSFVFLAFFNVSLRYLVNINIW